MDLATITMPEQKAREKFLEYRRAVRARHDDEDEQIMRGYKALASGRRVIELSKTIAAGGFDIKKGRGTFQGTYALPRLAIAWADQPKVYIQGIDRRGALTFFWNENLNPQATRRNVRLEEWTFDVRDVADGISVSGWRDSWEAQVPHVPPPLRPHASLAGYQILWEAEWHQHRPPAPRDPALLKHIGGDLYAVVAVWDLTDLERAVLSSRG